MIRGCRRVPLSRVLWLWVTVLISGCGSFSGGEDTPQRTPLTDYPQSVAAELLWSLKTGGKPDGRARLQTVLNGGVLYAVAGDVVVAVDVEDGRMLWQYRIAAQPVGGLGVGGGRVLISDIDGRLWALSAADGKLLWERQLGRLSRAAAAADRQLIVVNLVGGRLSALGADDGLLRWSYRAKAPALSQQGNAAPLLFESWVLAGFDDGQLVALSRETGEEHWRVRLARQRSQSLEGLVDIDGNLLVADRQLYAVALNGKLSALEVDSGEILWQQPLSSSVGPVTDGRLIYAVEKGGIIRAFAAEDGRQQWQQTALTGRSPSAPAVVGAFVLVCDAQGYCHFLNRADGSLGGRFHSGRQQPTMSIPVDGDVFYLLDDRGNLQALGLADR